MYTAVVLTEPSRAKLIAYLSNELRQCEGWEVIAHHMTINMGKLAEGPASHIVARKAELIIDAVGWNTGVLAVRVEAAQTALQPIPSVNPTKHITVAVNRDIATPKDSKGIVEWKPITPFVVWGQIEEVKS